jgi:hypothetical protein
MLLIFNVTVADEDIDGQNAADLDAITEADALHIEDEIDRKKVNRVKLLEWLEKGGHLIGGKMEVRAIAQRVLPEVLRTLKAKCDREHAGQPCQDKNCHVRKAGAK